MAMLNHGSRKRQFKIKSWLRVNKKLRTISGSKNGESKKPKKK